jgi:hypothetical protein
MISRRIGMRAWVMASVLAALGLAAACTDTTNVGDNGAGDGGILPGTTEGRCGDGLDENGNGFVDEGCPCTPGATAGCFPGPASARQRGACKDGAMVCPGSGEFSTWGGECHGATLPEDETCNGIDDDCDGALDEGCACSPAGEVRSCGEAQGLSAPCKPGQQTCGEDGSWSDCDGAVLPEIEVCGDDIDNDCSGDVDDGCETDAGTGGSGGTGGTGGAGGTGGGTGGTGGTGTGGTGGTSPSNEVCDNGLDDDENGLIDDGCEDHCPCAVANIKWERIQSPDNLTLGGWEAARSVWTGKEHLFAYVGSEQEYSDSSRKLDLYLARWLNDGSYIGTFKIADVGDTWASTDGLVWTGSHAVVMAEDTLVQVAPDGTVVKEVDAPKGNSIAWNGHEIGRLSYGTGTLLFDRLDADLNPLDSPVEIADTASFPNLGWTGARWMVVVTDGSGGGGRVLFLDGSTVTQEYEVPNTMTSPMMATNGHGALVCSHKLQPGYSDTSPVTCQRYTAEGAEVGSPIVIDQGPFRVSGGGIVWWQCAYLVMLPGMTIPAGEEWPVDTSRAARILDDGTLESMPLPATGPDISGAGAYFWYFHSDFDDIEYTPGDLFFETRWFSPYMKSGRLRLSCAP